MGASPFHHQVLHRNSRRIIGSLQIAVTAHTSAAAFWATTASQAPQTIQQQGCRKNPNQSKPVLEDSNDNDNPKAWLIVDASADPTLGLQL